MSSNIEDKLYTPESSLLDDERQAKLPRSFMFPSRSKGLEIDSGRKSSEKFPKDFSKDSSRGIALHSFANHELLALELMALCLIKFPNADPSFRKGLYYTMIEEQEHCRLYCKRMNELGVGLGDIPVNRFFWDTMNEMKSPLGFISKMSLIFEQANLDYSLYYHKIFKSLGDTVTSDIMKTVYEDEIGHLANGVKWFEHWDTSGKPLFESHEDKIDFPLSLKWAKGIEFDEEGRLKAGLSKDYVEKLKVFQKSRGSVPDIYIFNPGCEEKYGKPTGDKGNTFVESFAEDLEFLNAFLAKSHDVILVKNNIPKDHILFWKNKGLNSPEIVESSDLLKKAQEISKGRKIGTLSSWGSFSEEVKGFSNPQQFKSRCNLFSKVSLSSVVNKIYEEIDHDLMDKNFGSKAISSFDELMASVDKIFESHENAVVKANLGSSGRGNLKLNKQDLKRSNALLFVKNLLKDSAVIVEPWQNRVCDFSFVGYADEIPSEAPVGLLRPLCDNLGQYRGHFVGGLPLNGLPRDVLKVLYDEKTEFQKLLTAIKNKVLSFLSDQGYKGAFGVDLYIYKEKSGKVRLAVSEINVRTTMGHVAKRISKVLGSKPPHLWVNLPKKIICKKAFDNLVKLDPHAESFLLNPVNSNTKFLSILIKGKNLDFLMGKLKEIVLPEKAEFIKSLTPWK